MTVNEILGAIAPNAIIDPDKDIHIQLATQRTNSVCFGENYEYAIALRAAHTISLKQRSESVIGDSGGNVSSKKEGKLSLTFSSSLNGDEDLSQTSYGKQLIGLKKGNIPPISVVSCNPLPEE